MKSFHSDNQAFWSKGYSKLNTLDVKGVQKDYQKTLMKLADIQIKNSNVLVDIGMDSLKNEEQHPTQFRNCKYTIIDEQTFVKDKCEE